MSTLAITKSQAIYISTPAGVITLQFVGKNRVKLDMPSGVRAFKDIERAVDSSPFLELRDGKVYPSYDMLVPRTNADGEIIGVRQPQALRVRRAE